MSDITRIGIRNGIEDLIGQWVAEELAPWEGDDDADEEMLMEAITKLQDKLSDYVSNLG